MAVELGSLTHGVSRQGAETLKTTIRLQAIEATKEKLSQTENISSTFEANWQGQSELQFMNNLNIKITKLKETLDKLEEACSTEIDNIVSSALSLDEQIVENIEE